MFPKNEIVDDVDSHESEHSAALHPNEEKPEEDGGSVKTTRKLGCCLKTWVKLDEWILRDLLIYNYKMESRKSQQMFFEMYEDNGHEVAAIIKEAAQESKDVDEGKSNNSNALREKVQALKIPLKRRNTIKIDQDAINADEKKQKDDDFEKV